MNFLRLILGPFLAFLVVALVLAGLALAWMEFHPITGAAGEAWRVDGVRRPWAVARAGRTDTRAEAKGPWKHPSTPKHKEPSKRTYGDLK